MTLAEIYTTICSLVYGDPVASPPPAHEVARIQDEILMYHHKVQQDYNYWFMYYRTTLALISGTYTYTLPTAYKELIRLDTDYEYELMGTNIYFCDEDVTVTESVRFDYWQFLPTPLAWSNIFTDAATQYCHWIIIYSVSASLLLKREGIQMAQYYTAKAEDAAASAQNEDFFRRQDPKTTW